MSEHLVQVEEKETQYNEELVVLKADEALQTVPS
jgi:hypothetical protein